MDARIFLLSPAWCGGERARMLMSDRAQFELATRLRSRDGATLGEVFAFLSGLYFRGKLAYARAFARPPAGGAPELGALVITPNRGLVPAESRIDLSQLRAFGEVDIDSADPRYTRPLLRDARMLQESAPGAEIVLLGSVASTKYGEVLLDVFGERLLFPPAFVGRGDMSRGGLMLRCARAGTELEYLPFAGAVRHGPRPPKLEPLRR